MIYVLRFVVLANISIMVHTTKDMCIRTQCNQPYHMNTLLQLKLCIESSHASTTHKVSKLPSFHTNTLCVLYYHVTIYTLFYNKTMSLDTIQDMATQLVIQICLTYHQVHLNRMKYLNIRCA